MERFKTSTPCKMVPKNDLTCHICGINDPPYVIRIGLETKIDICNQCARDIEKATYCKTFYEDETTEVLPDRALWAAKEMQMITEETKIESNSLVLQEGRLLFQLGLRDEAHKYSNMGVDSLLGLASVEVVVGILEIAGADAWECLRGTSIRVRRDEATGAIKEIGHITEDTWVDIVQVNR